MVERRALPGRAAVLLVAAYVLTLGGTFNGLLIGSLQQFSLMLLTLAVAIWLLVIWRYPPGASSLLLGYPLLCWGAAYAVAILAHPSERAYTGLWYAGLYAGLWLILVDLRQRGLPGRWITDAALLTAVPLMLLALLQVADWFPAWAALKVRVAFAPPRPPSALGNPNALGAVLAILIPLGWQRRRWAARRPDRVLWAIWTLAALAVLFLTYSRGAWLAALAGMAAYGMLTGNQTGRLLAILRETGRSRRARAALILAAVGIALLGVIAFSAFRTPRRETGSRLAFYEIAWRSFRDHPLTGTGPFTYGLTLAEHRSIPPDQPHAHAHNLILNVAAELGLPGLIALGVTVAVIVRRSGRRLRQTADPEARAYVAACGAGVVAFGAQQLVDMPSLFPAVFLLMLGLLAAGIAPDHQPPAPPTRLRRLYRPGVTLLWGLLLITGGWSAHHYTRYLDGERWLIDGSTQRGVDALRQAAEAQPLPLYQAEYGYACGLLVAQGEGDCLPDGIAAYRRALDAEPPHADWWANLAVLYWQAGDREAALASLIQAVHYAPDSPDLWFNLGFYHEMAGQPDRARAAYQHTLALAPVWANTHTWIASELRRDMLADHPAAPTPYMQAVALWQAKQPEEAIRVLEATIDRDPTEPGPYARLARLFIQGGNFERAQEYLDAAQVLAQNRMDRAWIDVVKSDLAAAQGDQAQADAYRKSAQQEIWPDDTGSLLPYGSDVAYYQFLRLRVPGTLLPPLVVLSPDPELIDLLR